MGITSFAQIMHDWQRMCKYFDEHYHEDCCHICPIQNCGAIWEMEDTTDWGEIEEIVNTWSAEHPEPKYPSWREYLKKIGLIDEQHIQFQEYSPNNVYYKTEKNAAILNEKANQPIPAKIADVLGLEPHYE